jgi:7,8-dihydropterin-6-yl-methyl-4-(beta-D-ribofuranosyl)aminobenzene 5'-phosphate synthase
MHRRGVGRQEDEMDISIFTLVENSVQKPELIAEYGLSFLVTTKDETILFDTGQGFALISNAARMGIDLNEISSIVLSHGHHDHTGGLSEILNSIGSRQVYAHPSAFLPKYSKKDSEPISIGIPTDLKALKQAGMEHRGCTGPIEVSAGILLTGPIPRTTDFEQVPSHFLRDTPNGSGLIHDSLEDDQALIIAHKDAPVLVLGCSHSGLINTLLYAVELTGKKHFSLVVGGTHLISANDLCLKKTEEHLDQFKIDRIAPCHCTGFRGQIALWQKFGQSFVLNSTGDRIVC